MAKIEAKRLEAEARKATAAKKKAKAEERARLQAEAEAKGYSGGPWKDGFWEWESPTIASGHSRDLFRPEPHWDWVCYNREDADKNGAGKLWVPGPEWDKTNGPAEWLNWKVSNTAALFRCTPHRAVYPYVVRAAETAAPP